MLVQHSPNQPKTMIAKPIFATEMSIFMSGATAFHVRKDGYMTGLEESVLREDYFSLTSSHSLVGIENTDHSMVLSASNAQITLVLRIRTQDVEEMIARSSKSRNLMVHVTTAHRVQDQTS